MSIDLVVAHLDCSGGGGGYSFLSRTPGSEFLRSTWSSIVYYHDSFFDGRAAGDNESIATEARMLGMCTEVSTGLQYVHSTNTEKIDNIQKTAVSILNAMSIQGLLGDHRV